MRTNAIGANGLNLLVAAIILWNTVYLQRAVDHLRKQGIEPGPDDLAHLSPLGWEHINLTGDLAGRRRMPTRKMQVAHGTRTTAGAVFDDLSGARVNFKPYEDMSSQKNFLVALSEISMNKDVHDVFQYLDESRLLRRQPIYL